MVQRNKIRNLHMSNAVVVTSGHVDTVLFTKTSIDDINDKIHMFDSFYGNNNMLVLAGEYGQTIAVNMNNVDAVTVFTAKQFEICCSK